MITDAAKFNNWANLTLSSYLAMELLRGGSLRDRLRKGKMPIAEAVKITQAVAQALDHAHQRGIIHRDVSPQNIMFDEKGQVKLTDFGIAKVMDEATITQGPIGKAPYMSPEQCAATRISKVPPTSTRWASCFAK